MSEVVGSILLVATTLVVATGFAAVLFGGLVGPQEPLAARLEVRLQQDDCPWGNGEEGIQVRHVGGEPLPAGSTTVRVTVGDSTHRFEGNDLGGPFASQGALRIGDVWSSPRFAMDSGALVLVDVTSRANDALLVFSESFRVPQSCVEGAA